MKDKTLRWMAWIVAAGALVLVACAFPFLPEQVPTHWNLDGTVTYSGKGTLWLLGLMPLALTALMRALPRVDPRRGNYSRFQSYYDGFVLVMGLFLLCITAVTVVESLRPGTLAVWRIVVMAVGLLLVFLGNMLPKVKSNFFLGVKTPWTLSDPDVWNRSQRLGGRLFFLAGLAMMASGLLLGEHAAFAVTMAGALGAGGVPCVMSYIWYRQKMAGPVDKGGDE